MAKKQKPGKKMGNWNDDDAPAVVKPIRKYPFDLPIHLSGLEVGGVVHILQDNNVWDALPAALQSKVSGDSFWSGVDITKEDLDTIDDKTFAVLNKLLKQRNG